MWEKKNLLKMWEILGITEVRTNLFIFCYPVNKALYLFPPGFNTLAELREGYRRSVHMEQIYMHSRNHLRLKIKEMLKPEILRLCRERRERSLLPTEEPPRKAGKWSQDDEN